jgi:hypothetical protein
MVGTMRSPVTNVLLAIRSGGQSGVDRAALDVARALQISYRGWCPRGGWAEDLPSPPGLLAVYPGLTETPSWDPAQRTAWNVRDSDATLIVTPGPDVTRSPGTAFTRECADSIFVKPLHIADLSRDESLDTAAAWLRARLDAHTSDEFLLNIAGPRESESRGIHDRAMRFLTRLFERDFTVS